ncbi:activator of HSP90 ATPase [Leptospira ognonensis]|uniref:Activator of HSP90 ATPase n=1 Tax=Leptospira ognonensis TaxID=2484945 RepID=A0A4R9JXS6_9LEPT|nr:activator of HSP90 ATPase [Leptospira ognonensis]
MKQAPLTVQAKISSDVHKVWNYYTAPEHITKWNFADPSWHCPSAENDLKAGGKYKARMEAKDGSFGFDFEAVYSEVLPEKKLAFTMEDGREATVLFQELGNETNVIITFDAENENPIEMQIGGWQSILDQFKKYTEG